MATRSSLAVRIPLVLFAAANLAYLGFRLWPWPEVLNLPVNGTAGFDPAISLAAYIGLIWWISGLPDPHTQKALMAGTIIGLPAGLILVAQVVIGSQPTKGPAYLPISLLVAAGVLWGIAGIRGCRATGNAGIGILAGSWSAMVSCLMACATVLARIDLSGPQPVSLDPWKQYQGLAIGNQAVQALVHNLNTATGFLLIGPLVGGVVGLLFALCVQ